MAFSLFCVSRKLTRCSYLPVYDLASPWTLPLPLPCSSGYPDPGLLTGLVYACWFCTALPRSYRPWPVSWTCSVCRFSPSLPGWRWQLSSSIFCSGANLLPYPILRTSTSISTHLRSRHHQWATLAHVPLHSLTLSVSTFRSIGKERPQQCSSLCQVLDSTLSGCWV